MKAVRIRKFGEPSQALEVAEVPLPPLRLGEVRVKVQAAGNTPSDIANGRGLFPESLLPRILGRFFAGQIVEGPADSVGTEVWLSGADVGFTRDGTHAEFIDVPLAAAARKPAKLTVEQAATVGVPFCTADMALEKARLAPGEWVLVSGAAGAVGRAAIELAHSRRARVIALVRDEVQQASVTRDKIEAIATSEPDTIKATVAKATGGKGADIALNGIGAVVFPSMLAALSAGGRMAVYGVSLGGREIKLDLFPFYRKRLEIIGINTIEIDAVAGARILSRLAPWFDDGTLTPPVVAERYPLEKAVTAYERVRTAKGKVIFTIS